MVIFLLKAANQRGQAPPRTPHSSITQILPKRDPAGSGGLGDCIKLLVVLHPTATPTLFKTLFLKRGINREVQYNLQLYTTCETPTLFLKDALSGLS